MVSSYKLDRASEIEARAEKLEARAHDLRQKAKLFRSDQAPKAAQKLSGTAATARAAWRRLPMSLGLAQPDTRATASSISSRSQSKPDDRRSSRGAGPGP